MGYTNFLKKTRLLIKGEAMKDVIAATSKLEIVRTKLKEGCLYEVLSRRKEGKGLCFLITRDEKEAREKFKKLKKEM